MLNDLRKLGPSSRTGSEINSIHEHDWEIWCTAKKRER